MKVATQYFWVDAGINRLRAGEDEEQNKIQIVGLLLRGLLQLLALRGQAAKAQRWNQRRHTTLDTTSKEARNDYTSQNYGTEQSSGA